MALHNVFVIDGGREHIFQFTAGTPLSEVKLNICAELGLTPVDIRLSFAPNARDVCDISSTYHEFEERHIIHIVRRNDHQEQCRRQLLLHVERGECGETAMQLEWCKDYLPYVFRSAETTPWLVAIERQSPYILPILAKWYFAGINDPDIFGRTPISRAASLSNMDCLNMLIKLGANVNMGCALHEAVRQNKYQAVLILIWSGASIYCRQYGKTPLVVDKGTRCSTYIKECMTRRAVSLELMHDRASYLGLLPMDLWRHYLDLYLYNAPIEHKK